MVVYKRVKLLSATNDDAIQVQAKHVEWVEDQLNIFLKQKPAAEVLDVKLLSVGTRDTWAMIIYEEDDKQTGGGGPLPTTEEPGVA